MLIGVKFSTVTAKPPSEVSAPEAIATDTASPGEICVLKIMEMSEYRDEPPFDDDDDDVNDDDDLAEPAMIAEFEADPVDPAEVVADVASLTLSDFRLGDPPPYRAKVVVGSSSQLKRSKTASHILTTT